MTEKPDPFAHHPELRGRISDSETSFFRGFNVDDLFRKFPELEQNRTWVHTDEQRETIRAKALADHKGDLWVFAYGSLMWDPALRFQEVRRAFAAGYARRFILHDDKGGRGTKESPGLMAALDQGAGCGGLAFRIAEADIETETEILFRRELIAPGYLPKFIHVRAAETGFLALAFLADLSSAEMMPAITREEQVRCIACGAGVLGSSRDYLVNVVSHLDHLEIEDEDCTSLLREVDEFLSRQEKPEPPV